MCSFRLTSFFFLPCNSLKLTTMSQGCLESGAGGGAQRNAVGVSQAVSIFLHSAGLFFS